MQLFLRECSTRGARPESFTFDVRLAILGGYTARHEAERLRHIEELQAIGIEPSSRIPAFWPISASLLTTDSAIEVQGYTTSGEIEFALLFGTDDVYVAVASDQTDREFERYSIPRSKQLCHKILSRDVIPLSELTSRWDEITIRSEVRDERGDWMPYQAGTLDQVMAVEEMVKSAFGGETVPDGTVLLSGTIPLLDGVTRYSDAFRGELRVPGWSGSLAIEYAVDCLPDHPTELTGNGTASTEKGKA